MNKLSTKSLILCSLFAALIAVGAFIKIPIPVVPFTLQVLFTTLAGLLLGPKLGAISVGIYLLIGLIGIPVFTQGGGPSYIFQPTFGYLIGFLIGTYFTGYCKHWWINNCIYYRYDLLLFNCKLLLKFSNHS